MASQSSLQSTRHQVTVLVRTAQELCQAVQSLSQNLVVLEMAPTLPIMSRSCLRSAHLFSLQKFLVEDPAAVELKGDFDTVLCVSSSLCT